MSNTEALLTKLSEKITLLKGQYQTVVKKSIDLNTELNMLKSANASLREEVAKKNNSIAELENQLELAKSNATIGTNDSKLEDRVNQLVNEIDECISLLKEN